MKPITLDWRKRRNWLASIRHYAGQVLTSSLRAQQRPQCWSDDLSWLPDEGILPEFVGGLTNYYTHFKAFHGCRPLKLSSYYERGLLGQNSDYLCEVFRGIFVDLSKDDVESVIAQFGDRSKRERGAIWLASSDKFLVEECGHYIIQGSEYLMVLAAQLGHSASGEDYRFRLRRYGIPTILEVDIPVGLVSSSQHVEVAKVILSEWGQLAARRPLPLGGDPCYVVRHDIPPECVRGHYYPARIPDPDQGYRTCELEPRPKKIYKTSI